MLPLQSIELALHNDWLEELGKNLFNKLLKKVENNHIKK